MSDAPDFIWVWGNGVLGFKTIGLYPQDNIGWKAPYVRRAPAVLAELPEVKAMVASAVEEAALILRKMWNDPDATGESIEAAILAMIPENKP
jgi:hypothetical protein